MAAITMSKARMLCMLVLAGFSLSSCAQSGPGGLLTRSTAGSSSIKEFAGSISDLVDFRIDLRVGYGATGSAPTFISDYSLTVKKPRAQLFAVEVGTQIACSGFSDPFTGAIQTNLAGQASGQLRHFLTTPGLKASGQSGTATAWINVAVRETPNDPVLSHSSVQSTQVTNCP